MFPRRRLLAFALAVLATMASASAADAGWVTFKNDTSKAILVQEYVVVNGKKVYGRPTKLLPGESFREFQNASGVKNYDILDVNTPTPPLWSGPLVCKADSQTFSVIALPAGVVVRQVPELKKP